MTTHRYLKAPAYVGKELSLYIGGGDRKIQDGVYYFGGNLAKFVGMGFLVEAPPDTIAQKPAPVPDKLKSGHKTTKAERDALEAKAEKKAKAKADAEEAAAAVEAEAKAEAAAAEAKAAEAAKAKASEEGSVTKSPESPSSSSKKNK